MIKFLKSCGDVFKDLGVNRLIKTERDYESAIRLTHLCINAKPNTLEEKFLLRLLEEIEEYEKNRRSF